MEWETNINTINRWKEGNTGFPLIDALMRELNHSGFMSNRGRQIVASYLTLDLQQDWRYGAMHFEEKLIDHDFQSNYGSWNFASGIGPGKTLRFNVLKQSTDYDPCGTFIKKWCPELKNVPYRSTAGNREREYLHDPWNMPESV